MTVLGHKDLADHPEAQLRPQVIEAPDELELESTGVENAGAAIDVRGQVMQMIEAIIMLLSWHGRSLTGIVWWLIHKRRCRRPSRSQDRPRIGRGDRDVAALPGNPHLSLGVKLNKRSLMQAWVHGNDYLQSAETIQNGGR
jgi:hypothetical protein